MALDTPTLDTPIIDAHAHMAADSSAALSLLGGLQVRVLNISLGLASHGAWRARSDFGAEGFSRLAQENPERFAWCTSFDLPAFDEPSYAERVIAELERDFSLGAVACKVWKNLGMEVRDSEGRFVLIDHPLLEPVFTHLARRGCPVVLHVGEPKACWEPLDERSPHYDYYRENPEWHMHGKSGVPSWDELLGARDRLLAHHPKLRAVGAHLGSIEHDVTELAKRLERFPNFAVDTGGRLLDLALQETATVAAFFSRYRDRVLFGTDICLPRAHSEMAPPEAERSVAEIRRTYQLELDFYTTDRTLSAGRHQVRGLGLGRREQRALLHDNARSWFSGL